MQLRLEVLEGEIMIKNKNKQKTNPKTKRKQLCWYFFKKDLRRIIDSSNLSWWKEGTQKISSRQKNSTSFLLKLWSVACFRRSAKLNLSLCPSHF